MDPGSRAGVTFGVGGYYLMIYRICGTAVPSTPFYLTVGQNARYAHTLLLSAALCGKRP
jgi:hypothetical protein